MSDFNVTLTSEMLETLRSDNPMLETESNVNENFDKKGSRPPPLPQSNKKKRTAIQSLNSPIRSLWSRIRLPAWIMFCRLFNISRPLIVVFTVNNNCNWNCNYCYGDYPSKGTENNLTTIQLKKVIDDLADAGCIYMIVHGGEALLRKDIGTIIDYIKSKNIYVGFITNGQLFPLRMHELSNIDSLTFSLDGTEKNNDKNRGLGTFKMALDAIELATQNGFKVRVSATLTRHTQHDIEYLAALAKKLRVPVSFSILFRTNLEDPDDLTLSADEIRAALNKIKELKRRGFPLFTSNQNLKQAMLWPYERFNRLYLFEDELPKDFKNTKCYYGKFKFHFEGDGTVMPCSVLSANDFKGKNVLDKKGTIEAFKHVTKTNKCVACPHLSQSEWNLLMGMGPRQVGYLVKEQIKELTRVF